MPHTYLGMTIEKFPNMFMVLGMYSTDKCSYMVEPAHTASGPHQAFGNNPRSIEYATEWITDFIKYCHDQNITYVEPTAENVEKWTQHVVDLAQGSLLNEVDSWMTGVNPNVAGKQTRFVARYAGSVQGFRAYCQAVKDKNYANFKLE
jgi:hypothetical protein